MKTMPNQSHQRAMTKIELMVVVVVIALLAVVLLPMLARATPRAKRIQCVNNLKQIGLGFRIWPNDSSNDYPWMKSTKEGGTMEFSDSTNVFLHFRAAPNELGTPKILACPSDTAKVRSADFNQFDNRHLSYFIGLDARDDQPQTILSGDRNLMTNGVALGTGVFKLTANSVMGWTKAVHKIAGNIGLADGSVQQTSVSALQAQWKAQCENSINDTWRLAIP